MQHTHATTRAHQNIGLPLSCVSRETSRTGALPRRGPRHASGTEAPPPQPSINRPAHAVTIQHTPHRTATNADRGNRSRNVPRRAVESAAAGIPLRSPALVSLSQNAASVEAERLARCTLHHASLADGEDGEGVTKFSGDLMVAAATRYRYTLPLHAAVT